MGNRDGFMTSGSVQDKIFCCSNNLIQERYQHNGQKLLKRGTRNEATKKKTRIQTFRIKYYK